MFKMPQIDDQARREVRGIQELGSTEDCPLFPVKLL